MEGEEAKKKEKGRRRSRNRSKNCERRRGQGGREIIVLWIRKLRYVGEKEEAKENTEENRKIMRKRKKRRTQKRKEVLISRLVEARRGRRDS